jgi:hypothetical protein
VRDSRRKRSQLWPRLSNHTAHNHSRPSQRSPANPRPIRGAVSPSAGRISCLASAASACDHPLHRQRLWPPRSAPPRVPSPVTRRWRRSGTQSKQTPPAGQPPRCARDAFPGPSRSGSDDLALCVPPARRPGERVPATPWPGQRAADYLDWTSSRLGRIQSLLHGMACTHAERGRSRRQSMGFNTRSHQG